MLQSLLSVYLLCRGDTKGHLWIGSIHFQGTHQVGKVDAQLTAQVSRNQWQ